MADDKTPDQPLEDKIIPYNARGVGASYDAAVVELDKDKAAFTERFGVDLGDYVAREVGVYLHKGATVGKTNLNARGDTYDAAIASAVSEFGIDPAAFNQTVEVWEHYHIKGAEAEQVEEKQAEAAAKSDKTPTAGRASPGMGTEYML
ncbi:hypothetical protein HN587_02250 [Candidatus Woesearchaeota archaeon]|jgi:hypothetical protein|nr:hypothetical protein [Candidatus Woesearchaeota archaeon]